MDVSSKLLDTEWNTVRWNGWLDKPE